MKKAKVYMYQYLAGVLVEDVNGFHFQYDDAYLAMDNVEAISLTLPLSEIAYDSMVLFPLFDGLVPEGWLPDIAQKLNISCYLEFLLNSNIFTHVHYINQADNLNA